MTDLAIYEPSAVQVAIPDRNDTDSWVGVVSDVIKVANVIFDTPFVPEGLRGSAPAVAAAILAGREMGIGPMTSLQHIHVIKGKPAQSALLMRALIQAAGHKWEDGDVTDTRAVVRGCRRGESSWTEVTFTADQAKRAGIDLGKYPADKLYARATSRLARRKFADVIAGMPYSAEDLEDGDVIEGTVAETVPAITAPAVRTAQRKQRTQSPPPAQAASPVAAEPPPDSPQAGAGGVLPPLPGEEEVSSGPVPSGQPAGNEPAPGPDDTDYDTPGTVTPGQLTKLGATFTGLGFTSREREQRLVTASQIVGRDVTSSSELAFNEAKMLIDALERCGTRDNLVALLVSIEQDAAGEPGA